MLVEQTKIMMEAVKLKEENEIEESIQSFEKVEYEGWKYYTINRPRKNRTTLLAI